MICAYPEILHVQANGGASADCSNWQNACVLQTALSRATSGDEIWVAAGVHVPDVGAGQTNDDPASTFSLVDGVSLYGGFAGTETDRAALNRTQYVTVLSGDIDSNDVVDAHGVVRDVSSIQGNNAHNVVMASDLSAGSVLDGFTVTAGADGTDGGGIRCDNASPTLSRVVIVGNGSGNGAGMSNLNGSYPVLVDVVFRNNLAFTDGGGMFNIDSAPSLINAVFEGNGANNGSGGAMANKSSSPTMVNVIITGNFAQRGAGILNDEGNPFMANVTLAGNRAHMHAAGMENYRSYPIISNTIFWGNEYTESPGKPSFAVISNVESNPSIANSIVQGSGGSGTGWNAALGSDGGHNLDDDPRFVRNPDLGDDDWWTKWNNDPGNLRLLNNSPAVDAGNTAYLPADFHDLDSDGNIHEDCPLDLDNRQRVAWDSVDMGAYEIQPETVFLPLSIR